MPNIVINRCYGGFGLSDAAMAEYRKLANIPDSEEFHYYDLNRDDPLLVQVVEKLGESANGGYAELKIILVPDDVVWKIEDYDGMEKVSEIHREWY
jgi:hypothetical protein